MPSVGIGKKLISTFFAGSLAFSMMPSGFVSSAWADEDDSATSAASSEAVIVYDQDATQSEKSRIAEVCSTRGAQLESVSASGAKADEPEVATVTTPDAASTSALMKKLQATDGVACVQENHVYHTLESASLSTSSVPKTSTSDAASGKQYYLDDWNADAATRKDSSSSKAVKATKNVTSGANVRRAWSLSKNAAQAGGNAAVTIAELDTGVDAEHEDLADNIDTEHMGTVASLEDGSYTVERGVCEDVSSDGHGTHVAGILAASADNGTGVAGVSYNAKLLPVNVYYRSDDSDDGSDADSYVTDTAHLIAGLSYLQTLIDEGELTNLRVVNMSLGNYADESDETDYALESAIKTLRDDYNVLTVCAGGNGDADGSPNTDRLFPSDFEESFSVSWLDADGRAAASADYNEYKDISAPGTDIYSTATSFKNHSSYSSLSGSSMAAPIVSGAAALLWAKYPSLTTDEVTTALQQSAHEIPDKPEGLGSAGAVDAAAALVYAQQHYSDASRTDISKATVTSTAFEDDSDWYLPYTGSALRPVFELRVGDTRLEQGVDYAVSYRGNVSAGTATVSFTGLGSYKGLKVVHFDVVQDISTCSVSPVAAKAYTGAPVRPDLEVTDADDNELAQGADYIVEDQKNTDVGLATVVIRGIHGYRGTLTCSFYIVEKSSDADTKNVTVNTKTVTVKKLAAAVKSNTTTVTLGPKVAKVSAGAFASFPKVTKLVLKTKKLTKSSTKDALKGSKVKKVTVSLGSKKLNDKYLKKYEPYFN